MYWKGEDFFDDRGWLLEVREDVARPGRLLPIADDEDIFKVRVKVRRRFGRHGKCG